MVEEFLCRNDVQVAGRAIKRRVCVILNKLLADFEKLGEKSETHVSNICHGDYFAWCIKKGNRNLECSVAFII